MAARLDSGATPGPASTRVLAGFLAYIVAFSVFLALHPFGRATFVNIEDIASTLPALAAGLVALYAGRQAEGRARTGWLLIGLGGCSWGLGEAVWSFYEIVLARPTPFPSLADPLYLAGMAFPLVGIVVLTSPRNWRGRLRTSLDALAMVAAAVAVTWNPVVRPILEDGSANLGQRLLAAAYPLGDLTLLFALMLALPRQRMTKSSAVLAVFSAGLAAYMIADLIYAYLSVNEKYSTGSVIDAGWVAGYCIMGCAAYLQLAWQPDYRDTAPSLSASWRQVVPLSALPLLGAWLVLNNQVPALRDIPALAVAVVAISLVAARQTLSVLDAVAVNQELAAAYQQLSIANALLQKRAEGLEQKLVDELRRSRLDGLTGLLNRSAMDAELRLALETARIHQEQLAVGMIDLDSLKEINDRYGHNAGDEALKAVAELLREEGSLASRYGGDEFLVLLIGGGRPQSEAYREGLMNRLEGRFVQAFDGGLRVSAGFAVYPDDALTVEGLLRLADERMYSTKSEKRSRARQKAVA